MAEKKAIVVFAPEVSLQGSGEAFEKLNKKAALLAKANSEGLDAELAALEVVATSPAELATALEQADLVTCTGEEGIAAAIEAANRRTLVVVVAKEGVAFYGLAVNNKAGVIERAVQAADIALTIATIIEKPISAECTAAIIYQVLKDPNLKLTEIIKLREALARMESVIERNNREPWDKHDCA